MFFDLNTSSTKIRIKYLDVAFILNIFEFSRCGKNKAPMQTFGFAPDCDSLQM